jgi:putative hemolysin
MMQNNIHKLNDTDFSTETPEKEKVIVRLATCPDEIEQAQKLRYIVFYEENGAQPTEEMRALKRDLNPFDEIMDHLVVVATDPITNKDKIVGTYRLLRQSVAEKYGQFYSSDEYDLTKLVNSNNNLLELGRSCVLADYRTKPILNLLWEGIADYIADHNIDILFGCASFHGTSVKSISQQLSYLHHYHSAPEHILPRSLDKHYVDMNGHPKDALNERRLFSTLPPLIKGYLRLGATIGDGAYIDYQFNTIDVCIVLQTEQVAERYRKYYERKIQKTIPGQKEAS